MILVQLFLNALVKHPSAAAVPVVVGASALSVAKLFVNAAYEESAAVLASFLHC